MGLFSIFKKKKKKQTKQSVGTLPTHTYPLVEPVPTKELLKDWIKTVEMVENHPLSQVRIINTAILTDLTRILHEMNEKLGKLDKIDKVINMLKELKSNANIEPKDIDEVILNLKGLTIKDREYLSLFKDNEFITTEEFAKRANLSRSTASSRLNKLFSLGVLEKKSEGKKILFGKKI